MKKDLQTKFGDVLAMTSEQEKVWKSWVNGGKYSDRDIVEMVRYRMVGAISYRRLILTLLVPLDELPFLPPDFSNGYVYINENNFPSPDHMSEGEEDFVLEAMKVILLHIEHTSKWRSKFEICVGFIKECLVSEASTPELRTKAMEVAKTMLCAPVGFVLFGENNRLWPYHKFVSAYGMPEETSLVLDKEAQILVAREQELFKMYVSCACKMLKPEIIELKSWWGKTLLLSQWRFILSQTDLRFYVPICELRILDEISGRIFGKEILEFVLRVRPKIYVKWDIEYIVALGGRYPEFAARLAPYMEEEIQRIREYERQERESRESREQEFSNLP